ncbi:MAG: phosphoribosyltransferase, partial [Candidatus Heimdallarchaeota archaeon]|nr:phosphoribosyltransferase [Candidatus Heimdallarchaeota archaeon]
IKESGFKPDVMAGVSRGGLVPARILSDLFLAEKFKVTLAIMQVGFYSGVDKTFKEPIIYQDLPGHIYGRKVLLVDDVADSGVSLEFALKYLKMKKPSEIMVGCLYHKPWSSLKPDFFVEETSSWIVFPHERMEFMAEQYREKNMSNDEARKFFVSEVGISEQSVDNFLKLKGV